MMTVHDVARYFLSLVDEEAGDAITNMKLQKLVYYAQGFNLALQGEPLFPEQIEAWPHGPVVPELYHAYKGHGSGCIPVPGDVDFSLYAPETRELLDEVYRVYGQFSAWKLRNMTHEEIPWVRAMENGGVISHEDMCQFFKTQLVDA
jgi:uncharacterized phage-associated protein